MTSDFYDRTAERLRFFTPAKLASMPLAVVEKPDPETTFTQIATELLKPGGTVLDIGTGDGVWFSSLIGTNVGLALGIDSGAVRLARGAAKARESGRRHADLVLADASYLPVREKSVDLAISRRGPITEDARTIEEARGVLKVRGRVLTLEIGEQNMREVEEGFGRGQMYEARRVGSKLDLLKASFMSCGLVPFITEDLLTYEYFPNRDSLEYRLLTAPILVDFDPVGEGAVLDEVVRRHTTARGIKITFHRLILAAQI